MNRKNLFLIHGLLLAALFYSRPCPAAAGAADPAPSPAAPLTARGGEASFAPQLSYGDVVLNEDTVWKKEVLVEGAVTVAPQATLTVEPGTVVRFRKGKGGEPVLLVEGRIDATGTKESPIRFTSSFATPTAADWHGITILGSEKNNVFENCRIDGAKIGIEALFARVALKGVRAERSVTGMRFQDTLVTMEGGGASDCDTGMSLAQSEATLRGVSLFGNRLAIGARQSSVYLQDGSLTMNRSAFTCDNCRLKLAGGEVLDNGRGVTLTESEGSVTGVKLSKNTDYGLSLTGARVRVSDNAITGNGQEGILVFDGAAVAWGNVIEGNVGYDVYNAGVEEFRAPANRWGTSGPKIYDNGGLGKVNVTPEQRP